MSSSLSTTGDAARDVAPPAAPAPAAPARVAFPPLEGSARVFGTVALSLATFMNVLDTSIANVSIPAIAGDMGVSPVARHVGHHVVRRRQRDRGSVDRLAHAALRPGAPVHRQRAAVRDRVVAVRPGAEHRDADLLPRRAGPGRGADDSAVADAAARELSARKVGHRDGDLGDDHAGCAGRRSAARRLDHRQHLVAVDLLHQHPGRPAGGRGHVVDLSQARSRPAQSAARLRRPRVAGHLGRRDADHARQGQGTRLVRVGPDRHARGCCGGRVCLLPRLGAHGQSTRSSICVCSQAAIS